MYSMKIRPMFVFQSDHLLLFAFKIPVVDHALLLAFFAMGGVAIGDTEGNTLSE